MSYYSARFKKKKPPPNPIVVGCGGTIFLALLYAVTYGLWTLLKDNGVPQVEPAYLRALMNIPYTTSREVAGILVTVPIPDELILATELTLVVIVLAGFFSFLYSFYASATREKDSWELYLEEAERQAKSSGRR